MNTEKVLYTDGHEVTVTESIFQVKKTMYQLKGIIHHDFLVLYPPRIPALTTMLIGALTIFMAALHWQPIRALPTTHLLSAEISGTNTAVITGCLLILIGVMLLIAAKVRYAIRLETAEGARNVLISKRKEYVAQVLEALNKAFLSLVAPKKELGKHKRGKTFLVGSR